jgi:hypothetical protein
VQGGVDLLKLIRIEWRAIFLIALLSGVGTGCGRRNVVSLPPCPDRTPAGSLDLWPGWDSTGAGVYYIHTARSTADSTCFAWRGVAGGEARFGKVSADARECEYSRDGRWVVYSYALELWLQELRQGGLVRQLTRGSFSCHWPRWDPSEKFIVYSRGFGYPELPDSASGLHVIEVESGADRAVMRTQTEPWVAVGGPAWSPDGGRFGFVSGDTSVDGRMRFVVVESGGGGGSTVGWIDGVPGRVSWMRDGTGWLFDSTPRGCEHAEAARCAWHLDWSGVIEMSRIQLGDNRVIGGFPFFLSPDEKLSAHVGLVDASGLIVLTNVETGEARPITNR